MKKLITHFVFVVVISSILFLISCRKEMEKAHWDTNILAPLINASLSIDNILPDSILQINPDSSLKVVYQNDIFNLTMDSLFSIPDTTLKNFYTIPVNITLSPGQVLFNNTTETNYNLKGVQLRKVIVKSGFVTYTIKSKVQEVTDFIYTIPSATLGGNPFAINVSVPAAVGNTPGVFSKTYDLSGYEFLMTGINKNKVNTIYTTISVAISQQGNPVSVTPNDSLIVENTFSDIIPYYAKGYFEQTSLNIGPDQSAFSVFNKITDGTIQLEDVKFNFNIENPIGLDARVFIKNLTSINTNNNYTVNLTSSIINSPININRASESNGQVFPTHTNIPLNTSNSNIKQLIENLPNKIGYTFEIETNPLGNISGSNDFIYSDKLLKTNLDMEIPLSFVANNLTLSDTLNFNISKENGAEYINHGILTLFANNGFPMDASIQMYLLNENNLIQDSIFTIFNTIYQAPVDANLKVKNKNLTKLSIPITEEKMDLLFDTKKVILKVKFNTASKPQYVKLYSFYTFDIKLVGDFNYTVYMQ